MAESAVQQADDHRSHDDFWSLVIKFQLPPVGCMCACRVPRYDDSEVKFSKPIAGQRSVLERPQQEPFVLQPASDLKTVRPGGLGHSSLAIDNPGRIEDFYDIDRSKPVGEGGFSSVWRAAKKDSRGASGGGGRRFAVKTVPKATMLNVDRLWQEIEFMKIMDHPNIVKLYESFEGRFNFYLVMELCAGGELFDRIAAKAKSGGFKESQAAAVMVQIFRMLRYMHNNKVCHRDLKPENFLFQTQDPIEQTLLKLIDFGFAHTFGPGQVIASKVGTPAYLAPEVLTGRYDHRCDMWSCGVIMYLMLCGSPPFAGKNSEAILAKVARGDVKFKQSSWDRVSIQAKDLVKNLLALNPADRWSAEQALNDEWVRLTSSSESATLSEDIVRNLGNFRSVGRLKKAALQVVALQLRDDQLVDLRKTFETLDTDGDGSLTANEMREGLLRAGFRDLPDQLNELVEGADLDGSGGIDYTEFLAATIDKRIYSKEAVLWDAFAFFDRDGSGTISGTELEQVLGDSRIQGIYDGQSFAEIVKEVDCDGDGEIDFREFVRMMTGRNRSQLSTVSHASC